VLLGVLLACGRTHAVGEEHHGLLAMGLLCHVYQLCQICDQRIPAASAEIAKAFRPRRPAVSTMVRRPDFETLGVKDPGESIVTQRVFCSAMGDDYHTPRVRNDPAIGLNPQTVRQGVELKGFVRHCTLTC